MTIQELWNSITFLILKTSLAIPPTLHLLRASLWRIVNENRHVAHPLSPPHAEKINEATRNLNNFVMLKLNRTKILKYKVFSFEHIFSRPESFLPSGQNFATLGKTGMFKQKSFISEIEWAPFKGLFWNANDSIVKLMVWFLLHAVFLCDTDLVTKTC